MKMREIWGNFYLMEVLDSKDLGLVKAGWKGLL